MELDDELDRDDLGDDSRSYDSDNDGASAKPFLWVAGVAALVGAMFSGLSTADFIQHLDRQMHAVHCSILPGAPEQFESGCKTIMMSPYSSIFRTSLWGGLPISLLALAVFSYLAARAVHFGMKRRVTRRETGYLAIAWLLPVFMSVVYGIIAASKVGAVCKLCVGIYVVSALGFVVSVVAAVRAPRRSQSEMLAPAWIGWFIQGVGYVVVLALLYLVLAPQIPQSAEGCGSLVRRDDPSGVMLSLGGRGTKAIAVLDPLCPSCRAFDQRLEASGLRESLDINAVLFPLDASCNWMLKTSLHPGACMVAEAMLCAPKRANEILEWAYHDLEGLSETAKADEKQLRSKIVAQFGEVAGCLGSPQVKNKITKGLRWAVANALPVLTPQLFIAGRRVCDEDTDLGLDYTITAMLARQQQAGALP